jgi:hypothetical protein
MTAFERENEMSNLVALLASRNGILITTPWMGPFGNADVVMSESKYGIWRDDELYGGRHHWKIHFGKKLFHINNPGDHVSKEEYDEPDQRVTRQVEFRGKTYTYHSGHRISYYENFPRAKEVIAIWMPDEKHADEYPGICSMGIGADIHETLEDMWQLGNS